MKRIIFGVLLITIGLLTGCRRTHTSYPIDKEYKEVFESFMPDGYEIEKVRIENSVEAPISGTYDNGQSYEIKPIYDVFDVTYKQYGQKLRFSTLLITNDIETPDEVVYKEILSGIELEIDMQLKDVAQEMGLGLEWAKVSNSGSLFEHGLSISEFLSNPTNINMANMEADFSDLPKGEYQLYLTSHSLSEEELESLCETIETKANEISENVTFRIFCDSSEGE